MNHTFCKGAKHKYSKAQAIGWLTWLARRMSQESQTIFLIEQLQPTWLQTQTQTISYRVKSFLIGGLLGGLIGSLVSLPNPLQGLLIGVPIAGLNLLWPMTQIKTVETLKWSWQEARKFFIKGLLSGIPLAVIVGLTLEWSQTVKQPKILALMLIYWLINALILGVLGGFRGPEIERKTKPNQGIWNSARNALFIGVIGGLIGILIGLLSQEPNWNFLGLVFGLISGLIYGGGKACIQHFTLRFIFYVNGYSPWNYANFLDYSTERIFLQKVGGSYIFIHRMLLEHFAKIEVESR